MRIAVFYRDVFQPGGVAGEIIEIANTLANQHEVIVWGLDGPISASLNPKIQCLRYHRLKDIQNQFSVWLNKAKPDFALLVGFFMIDNLPAARALKQAGVPMVLYPLSQITTPVLAGKIFTQDPDVRRLEQNGLQLPDLKEKMMMQVNPLLKNIYLNSIGRFLVANSSLVAVLSEFEARHFQNNIPTYTGSFVQLRWGINRAPKEKDPKHYYRETLGYTDGKANYVYWGRLDWHYKGIDRLLNGILHCVRDCPQDDPPFRLFLIGPDYRGGAEKIRQFVETHQLQHIVHLMLPGSYPAGSKLPLRDATASIYLSRWDGFPRTLRESITLGVPILVSEETHFGKLVTDYNSGLVLNNPDAPEEVAQALMDMTDNKRQATFKAGTPALASQITWHQAVEIWLEECEANLADQFPNKVAVP